MKLLVFHLAVIFASTTTNPCPPANLSSDYQYDNRCLNVTAAFCGFGYCSPTKTGVAECVCKSGIQGGYCYICSFRRPQTEMRNHSSDIYLWESTLYLLPLVFSVYFVYYLVYRRYTHRNIILPDRCTDQVAPQVTLIPLNVAWA